MAYPMDKGTRSMLLYLTIFYIMYGIFSAGIVHTFAEGAAPEESELFPSVPVFPTIPSFSGDWGTLFGDAVSFLFGMLIFFGVGIVFVVQLFVYPLTMTILYFPAPYNWILGMVMGAITAVLAAGLITWAIPVFQKITELLVRMAHAIAELVPF